MGADLKPVLLCEKKEVVAAEGFFEIEVGVVHLHFFVAADRLHAARDYERVWKLA